MAKVTVDTAAEAAITITLTSLADISYRQSAVVDNTTNEYLDAWIGGSIQTGSSPTAGTTIDIFVYGQWGGSGDYTAGCSGSDASYTADGSEDNLIPIGAIIVDGSSDQDWEFGPWSVAQCFGGRLPERWGIVVRNNTGSTLNATGTNNEVKYQGVKEDIT